MSTCTTPLPIERLRPHQKQPYEHLLSLLRSGEKCVIDASDPGVGKTYVGAAVASTLGLPTLVVGPSIARHAWERAARHFRDQFDFVSYDLARTGRTPYGRWGVHVPASKYLKCQACQLKFTAKDIPHCHAHRDGVHCVETKTKAGIYRNFEWHEAVRFLIFDEAHRLSNDSAQSELLAAATKQRIPTLCLTATPAFNPLQLDTLGHALGLHKGGSDFYRWSRQYGCRKHPAFHGWVWLVGKDRQRSIMEVIGREIFPKKGVRVRCEDIPGFPEIDIRPRLIPVPDPEALDAALAETADAVGDALKVTQLMRCRQQIELLKIPSTVEIANDLLATGHSVAIFVNFTETLRLLQKKLDVAGVVDGSTVGDARQEIIDRFQRNEDRIILCNGRAGGICIDLHDLAGDFPREGLVMPGYSAIELSQIFGRLRRLGGKSVARYQILLGEDTLEEKELWPALEAKRENLQALLTDADLIIKRR